MPIIYPPDVAWPGTQSAPALARPVYRQTVNELGGLGTTITRISGDEMAPAQTIELQHDYSKDQPWNADQTLIKLVGAVYILNATDYTVFKHWNWHNESRWSTVDPNILFYTSGSQLRKINVRTATSDAQSTLVYNFPGTITIGPSEGNLSDGDQRIVCMIGLRAMVLDIPSLTILGDTTFTSTIASDWVSISQSGNYVLTASNTGGGLRVYTPNLTFLRTLFSSAEHGDTAYDLAGNEVYAQTCGNQYGRLDTGAITNLTPSACNAHLSGRNVDRHGWAYIDQFNVCYAKRLDATNIVERFAWHRSSNTAYNNQPKGVVSPDGSKMMWNSDWGSGTVYAYVAEMPGNTGGGGVDTTPPAAPTGVTIQ